MLSRRQFFGESSEDSAIFVISLVLTWNRAFSVMIKLNEVLENDGVI